MSWVVLARLGRICSVLWLCLGAPESVLEVSWGHLGASWEDLGRVLGSLGGSLAAFWMLFPRILCFLEQNLKIAKNLGKPVVFH